MPPAIVAAVVAIGATAAGTMGVIAMTTAMVIAATATVAGALLTKQSIPSIGNYVSQQERKQVVRSAASPCSYIYGRVMTSGLLFFAEEEPGEQNANDKEWIHLAIAVCAHAIDGIEEVWLGDEPIQVYGEFAEYEVHSNRQTPDPFMLANCPSWRADMIGKGMTWVRISLKFDQDKFPSGIPNVKFLVRGKRVYDPRTGGVGWSQNAALIIRDFYLSDMLNVDPSDIDENMFIAAANICDEYVNTPTNMERRYTINGQFDASEAMSSILDDMHMACSGEPTYMAGRHGLLVGAYYGPATMVLNDDMVISDVKISPETQYADKVNAMTGTFVDPLQGYVEADFPTIRMQSWIDEDGNEFTQDLKLRFVTSEFQSQRIAQIFLNRKRLGRTIELTANYMAYAMRPGYYVYLTLKQLGIVNQEFRVVSWALSEDGGVNLSLRQETVAVWGDAIGVPIDRPDISILPVGQVPPPWNLQYQVLEIGEVVQGVLTWENTADIAYNNVIIRQNGQVVFTVQVPGQMCRLAGMLRGSYTAGVIAIGVSGARSTETYTEFVIQAPDAPVGCTVEQGYFAVTLKPIMAQLQSISTQFDFWTSGETRLSSADTGVVTTQASRQGVGNAWTKNELLNHHTYWWYVRAINSFGASPFLEVRVFVDADIGELMGYVASEIEKTDAFKLINEKVGDIGTELDYISSTVNQKMTSIVTSDGTAKVSYALNLGIYRYGAYYGAGMGISIEPNGAGAYRSTVVFKADQFGIYSGGDPGAYKLAFAVYNGQTFIDDAMIRDASITTAKIANEIASTSWYASNGALGWMINKDGRAYFRQVEVTGGVYASYGSFTGNVYANDGVFNGVVYARAGKFTGTVEASSFIGDVANGMVFDDVPQGWTRAFQYVDSATFNLAKQVVVMMNVRVQGANSGSVGAIAAITINGVKRSFSFSTPGSGVFSAAVMHSVRTSERVINVTCIVNVDQRLPGAGASITSPTMLILRGSGSFAQTA